MSYVIKDGSGATQTVDAATLAGAILPLSVTVDTGGNPLATAPGVGNTNSALSVQGVAGGVSVPVIFPTTQTVSITAAQLPTAAAQGSTTAGQSGALEMGAVTTAAPSYTNGQTSPLSLTTAGALRVDGSAVTQPANIAAIAGNAIVGGGLSGLLGVGGAVASGFANGANPVKIGGVFNSAPPTVSSGQIVDAQMSPRGAQIVAIGVEGFSPTIAQQPTGDALAGSAAVAAGNLLFNGSTFDRQRAAAGTTGVAAVDTESTKATYHQSANLAITGVGDNLVIQGSGTKTVRIKRIAVSGFLTTGSGCSVLLVRRSSAFTGGTAGTLDTLAKLDSNNGAATATVSVFSVAPTPGTNAGILRREVVYFPTASASASVLLLEFSKLNDQSIVLRGTSDYLGINLSTAAANAGSNINISIEWTEE